MADKTMPTPGPWEGTPGHPSGKFYGVRVSRSNATHSNKPVVTFRGIARATSEEGQANARLIAAAGTAASEVADMGYDPVEALRRWPKLLEAASALLADIDTCGHPVDPAYRDWLANELDRAAGKEGDDGR